MERNLSEKEYRNLWSFLVETFELTEEQLAAVDHQAPMSQEMYDSILDRCEEIGPDADRLFYQMLQDPEFSDFMKVRADRIEEEIKGVELPMRSKEEKELEWQKLLARIRAEYGEDAI